MAKKDEKENANSKEIQASSQKQAYPAGFDDFDQWFDDWERRGWLLPFFRRGWPDIEAGFGDKLPKVDVIDREAEIVVRAELPGVNKDDLEVSLSDNLLTIRAKQQQEKKEEKGHYHRREISRREFQRSLRLPANVEGEKTSASFKDGILELIVPKAPGSKRQAIKVD